MARKQVDYCSDNSLNVLYYISHKSDFKSGKVLWDTMGGYLLDSVTKNNGDWESKLAYSTYENAYNRLQELCAKYPGKFEDYGVMSIEKQITTSYFMFEAFKNEEEVNAIRNKQLVVAFEEFMKGSNVNFNTIRNAEGTGYTVEDIQKKFEMFKTLTQDLPNVNI